MNIEMPVNHWYHMALQGREFFRLTIPYERPPIYFDSLISFARKNARDGEMRRQREDRINQRVTRTSWGVSMAVWDAFIVEGRARVVQMGCGIKRGIAFRRVWVLWGAYGDARLKSMSSSSSSSFPWHRHTSRPAFLRNTAHSHGRGRVSVYCDVKLLMTV